MNDGIGLPYLYIPILLIQNSTVSSALKEWGIWIIGYQLFLPIFLGAIIGYLSRKAIQVSERKGFVDKQSFLAFSFALAVITIS